MMTDETAQAKSAAAALIPAHIILLICALPAALGLMAMFSGNRWGAPEEYAVGLAIAVLIVALYVVAAVSLHRGSTTAWHCCFVLAAGMMIIIPIGTLLGLVMLRSLDGQVVRDHCGIEKKQHFK